MTPTEIIGLGLAQLMAALALAHACSSAPIHDYPDRLRDPHDVSRVVQSHDQP